MVEQTVGLEKLAFSVILGEQMTNFVYSIWDDCIRIALFGRFYIECIMSL